LPWSGQINILTIALTHRLLDVADKNYTVAASVAESDGICPDAG
jgi:hypothetical protein